MTKREIIKLMIKPHEKKLVGIFLCLYFIAAVITCHTCHISYNIYSNEICCSVFFSLIFFIYFAFYFWLHEEKQNALKENSASFRFFFGSFWKLVKGRKGGFLALLIIFVFIWWSKGISFNNEQLYYWVFSTLAQVFGALLGLIAIAITTLIFSSKISLSREFKCLGTNTLRNEAIYLVYPTGFVLIYSIMALSLSRFLINCWFCKVLIIILGIEVPILAIISLLTLKDIFFECGEEMLGSGTK